MWNVKKKVVWWWETNETQRTPSEALSENGGRKKTRIGDVKWKKLDFRASRGALAVAVWAWCARRCRVHVWRVLASSGIHRHERISLRGSPYSVLVFHFTLHLSLALRIIFSHEKKVFRSINLWFFTRCVALGICARWCGRWGDFRCEGWRREKSKHSSMKIYRCHSLFFFAFTIDRLPSYVNGERKKCGADDPIWGNFGA